jgi:peptidoglycan/xylan/chitin deacetylase (PgdA/CDA1 family)
LGKAKNGFGLRITGDVDEPDRMDGHLLSEWQSLAARVSLDTPILYVTASPLPAFEKIVENSKGVEIGVHGRRHIDYTLLSNDEIRSHFREIVSYSRKFRFPYLARDLRTLKIASEYFDSDSSFTARWKPFVPFLSKSDFYEYPVIPPSDTFFRGKQIGSREAASLIAESIEMCRRNSTYCTLLLHPNLFVNELLKSLLESMDSLRRE